jgi:hypothetical protein
LTNCISHQIDHGVLIVGFDDNNNPPYWILKNSWASSWGENGFIRVQKGTNQCLITSYPCSAKVAKGGPTPPPTPPTPPGRKEFTQRKCKKPTCEDCKDIVLPQDECIAGAKYSYKGSCTGGKLIVDAFVGRKCQGNRIARSTNEINQCSIDFDSKSTEEFIQNLCHAGPAPPTPAPTAPPTPSPTQQFVQMDCSDSACTQGCTNNTFAANVCLPLSGGGSAIAVCSPGQLTLTEYPLSNNCTGFSIPSTMPLDQCLANGDGQGYFENFCPGQAVFAADRKANVLSTRRRDE